MEIFTDDLVFVENIGWIQKGLYEYENQRKTIAEYSNDLQRWADLTRGTSRNPYAFNVKLELEDGQPKLVLRIIKYGHDPENEVLTKEALLDFYNRFLNIVQATKAYIEIDTPLEKFWKNVDKGCDINAHFVYVNDGRGTYEFTGMKDIDPSLKEAREGMKGMIDTLNKLREKSGLPPVKPFGDVRVLDDVKKVTTFLFDSDFDTSDIFELSVGGQRMDGGQGFSDTKKARILHKHNRITPQLEELNGSFSYGKITAGLNSELLVSLGPSLIEFKGDKIIFKNPEARKLVEDILKFYGMKVDFITDEI